MAENSTISEMATKVSDELFSFFRWEKVPLVDQNFPCLKEGDHKPADKEQSHTHPVDVVFHYIDPYTGKRVFFNTDLKSYAKRTISANNIRKALNSLAFTIDCANLSDIWKTRYNLNSDNHEVRGMLFVYNHDGNFDDQFYKFFDGEADADTKSKEKKIRIESLKVTKGQFIHIIEPRIINYMTTIINDINGLKSKDSFPRKDYSFFYPELSLHRQHVADQDKRCASVEMICSPYLIIEHGDTIVEGEKHFEKGYLIYYNDKGESYYEFLYLFDILSKYQILNKDVNIRIRCTNAHRSPEIKSNFNKAITAYVTAWGFDDAKKAQLEKIEMNTIETYKTCFSQEELGWRE